MAEGVVYQGLRDLIGYEVYRDNVNIAYTEETEYLDTSNELWYLEEFCYNVVSVWDEGTSDFSNTACAIPQLNGPKGSERDVMTLFIKIDSLLIGRGLYLEAITLDARGSWSFTIKPKIEIKLGKTEINQKLERFFLALDQSLLAKIHKVSYIDLRYSEGLAVSWKKLINL